MQDHRREREINAGVSPLFELPLAGNASRSCLALRDFIFKVQSGRVVGGNTLSVSTRRDANVGKQPIEVAKRAFLLFPRPGMRNQGFCAEIQLQRRSSDPSG